MAVENIMAIFYHNPEVLFLGFSSFLCLVVWVTDYYHYTAQCMASFQCTNMFSNVVYFTYILLILFWSWIISLFTKYGFTAISWIAFIAPFFLVAWCYYRGVRLLDALISAPHYEIQHRYLV